MNKEDMQQIKISFGRCLTSGTLFDDFYDIFLKSDPRLAPMFESTDFSKQKGLLRTGLNLALMFATDIPAAQTGLKKLRKSHRQEELNIRPQLYPLWTNSFLKALEKNDTKMTPELLQKWRLVLEKAVDYIKGGYLEKY